MPAESRYLDRNETAAFFKISRSKLSADVAAGRKPAPLRDGRRVLWDIRILERFADARVGLGAAGGEGSWDDL